jgi:GNAT superfamily N-acetyltransferase
MELADRAAVGRQDGLHKLQGILGRGWTESHPGFVATVTEVPVPAFNGVSVHGDFDPAELTELTERVLNSGFPVSLQARPAQAEGAAAIAEHFGMERGTEMPMMGHTGPPPVRRVDGMALRELGPAEGAIHAAISAECFGAPLELMRSLATPAMIASPSLHFVAADLDGQTVATAVADVNGDCAWIYSVATVGAYRRRGLGAAVTVAAMDAARADGADAVFLMSSPMGLGIYRDLGFHQLEWWASWVAAAGA